MLGFRRNSRGEMPLKIKDNDLFPVGNGFPR